MGCVRNAIACTKSKSADVTFMHLKEVSLDNRAVFADGSED